MATMHEDDEDDEAGAGDDDEDVLHDEATIGP